MSQRAFRFRPGMAMAVVSSLLTCFPVVPAAAATGDQAVIKGKDNAWLRGVGRPMRKLPGIGTIYADNIEQAPGVDLVLSGQVFLERPDAPQDAFSFGFAHQARWSGASGTLSLQGFWVLRSSKTSLQSMAGDGEARLDQKGVLTIKGRHATRRL